MPRDFREKRNNASSRARKKGEMLKIARKCTGTHTAGTCFCWWRWEVRLSGKLKGGFIKGVGVRLATSGEKWLATRVTCIGD